MPTPRSVAFHLILLCGLASDLHAQATTPAPTWRDDVLQTLRAALAKVYPSGLNATSPTPAPVAQNGVFFLKERIEVRTKVGVTGHDPSAVVRVISENGNTVSVTDGTNTFDVSKDKLTANINEATQTAQNYYGTEQARAQAFNAEAVRIQEEEKRVLDQKIAAAAQERQRQMEQEQLAAQQEQQQLEAQRQPVARSNANHVTTRSPHTTSRTATADNSYSNSDQTRQSWLNEQRRLESERQRREFLQNARTIEDAQRQLSNKPPISDKEFREKYGSQRDEQWH